MRKIILLFCLLFISAFAYRQTDVIICSVEEQKHKKVVINFPKDIDTHINPPYGKTYREYVLCDENGKERIFLDGLEAVNLLVSKHQWRLRGNPETLKGTVKWTLEHKTSAAWYLLNKQTIDKLEKYGKTHGK